MDTTVVKFKNDVRFVFTSSYL